MKDVSSPYELIDSDRIEGNEYFFREVIQEMGITEPRLSDKDSWVRMPIRITHNTDDGLVLEIGSFDFTREDFDALEHAVKEMRWLLDHN